MIATTDTARVTFWDRGIKERLEGSTLSHGQAAKRDLDRYYRLLADALPAIPQRAAELLVAYHRDHQEELTDAPGIDSDAAWRHLADCVQRMDPPVNIYDPLYWLHPVERAALIDAADRLIAHLDAHHGAHLIDLLPTYFRITPEG